HFGGGAAGNRRRRKAMAKKRRENQSNGINRASRKRKPENNVKQDVGEKQTTLETGNPSTSTASDHIPLNSLMDVEMRLVCIDEEDIFFEFAAPGVSASLRSAYRDSENVQAPHGSGLPCIDKQLQMTLRVASNCYRQKNYPAAEKHFSEALKLCSKGAAIDSPCEPCPEDISSIASFIETKLVTCNLKLKKPNEALNHAHRSIILNPAYFRNHLRQAAAFRCLRRYSEAARSAMIADYIYWLTGGTEQRTSKLIKLYWQALMEQAIEKEVSFSVMYTPFVTEVKADTLNKTFAEKNPDYVEHIYTDPCGYHILPHATRWQALPPRPYLLTLGFKDKHIGKILERWSSRKLPIFSERKTPFSPPTKEDAERYWNNTGKKIVPVMDFIRSTKLTDHLCPCSRGIEKLHYASLLGHMQRGEEQSQVINQAMAELATLPYLQDISQQDAKLLQSLMADAMDILEGRSSEQSVWNEIQKV
ncbi:SPT16 protein, partial [Eurystomus gularis]|nr:SPT16 protein [Eurystomus gularis]